ncbi:MAG TPA: toll/interleukin-1 receptor domain-containing protein [Bacillota bacterium]|nr:toll/interleukin-1 receptor domain-containing protein [Bacillota bacterium]
MANPGKKWDVFISHASEDKDTFVRPLAEALRRLGVSVWYDEFTLRLGDSLSREIDEGLGDSRFGLVVISRHFIAKPWPEHELRGLVSREIDEGRVILPIWHGVDRKKVRHFSPTLADKVALLTGGHSAEDIAIMLLQEIRPDLYAQHPRAELEKRASGDALQELQDELEQVRQELSEYRCPHCQAPLARCFDIPLDPEQKDWDERAEFECRMVIVGTIVERPCPADPRFPEFDEFELHFQRGSDEDRPWKCFALGKTRMARGLEPLYGVGSTQEEAEAHVRARYNRMARKDDA